MPTAGILLGVSAAVCRAGYVLLNRRVGRLFNDWSGLAAALAVGACLIAPLGAISAGTRLLDHRVLATGVIVALLSSLLPYSLDLLVLRRISPRVFGILLSLGPAVAAFVGFLTLGETLSAPQLTAIALVTVATAATVADRGAAD